MLDAFISYSRRNLKFVERLSKAIETQGKTIWFDQKKEALSGIPAGSRWWDQIQTGIEDADNFLMIISPESMQSPYCHAEIARALKHNKRIVTLLYCDDATQTDTIQAITAAINGIPDDLMLPQTVSADIQVVRKLARRNWLELSQIQFVVYSQVRDWEQWLQTLLDAIDLDIQWVRQWSQFQQAVQIWAEAGYDDAYLWAEPRLKPIREQVATRQQTLSDHEARFIEPEQMRLLREIEDINTSHERRRDIGDRLAVIGDPRPGVGLRDDGLPDIEWLYVGGGDLTLNYQVYSVPDFYIARYVITYSQYQVFIESDHENPDWWRDMPEYYQDHINLDDHIKIINTPRGFISWFQCVAYARWLNQQLHQADLLPDTKTQVRLPTEAEWIWAAQNGNAQDLYPWGGDLWIEGHTNTIEAGLGRKVAVGMYPHSAASCGAMDMAGNMLEWCLTNRDNPATYDFHNRSIKTQHGGAHIYDKKYATSRYRQSTTPDDSIPFFGLRLVAGQKLLK